MSVKTGAKIKIKRNHLFAIGALVLLVSFQNCAAAKFTAATPPGSQLGADGNPVTGPGSTVTGGNGGGGTGTDPVPPSSTPTSCVVQNFNIPLKIIVMVDNSGSSFWTDANQTLRQSILRNFAQTYGQSSNISYNLSYFSDIQSYPASAGGNPHQPLAISLMNDGNNQNPIFGNESAFMAALDQYKNVAPLGNTPYYAGLDLVAKAIKDDPAYQANPTSQNYAILFMSDGLPDDNGEASFTNAQYLSYLQTNVLNLAPKNITFSTVYADTYSQAQAEAASTQTGFGVNDFWDADSMILLQQLATAGGGLFANGQDGASINLSQLITVPASLCSP